MGRRKSNKTEVLLIRCSPDTARRFRSAFYRLKSREPGLTYEDFLNLLLDYLEKYHVEGRIE